MKLLYFSELPSGRSRTQNVFTSTEVKDGKGVPEGRENRKLICVNGMIILMWILKIQDLFLHLILIP